LFNRSKILALAVLLCLPLGLLVSIPQYTEENNKEPPKFIISGWSYPDEYGQGIESIEIFENSTGIWDQVNGGYGYEDNYAIEWNTSIAIKISVWTWFNSTLTGAIDENEGKNYQRHNVTVTNTNGTVVFSQNNFTYAYSDDSIDPPMWFYEYEIVLNFLPEMGEIYTATITYEVFY